MWNNKIFAGTILFQASISIVRGQYRVEGGAKNEKKKTALSWKLDPVAAPLRKSSEAIFDFGSWKYVSAGA